MRMDHMDSRFWVSIKSTAPQPMDYWPCQHFAL
jgi:hypothetical protein